MGYRPFMIAGMSIIDTLLREITAYCREAGIAETTFGRLAVGDGKFVGRLRDGRDVTVRVVEQARGYMADNPPAARRRRRPSEDAA